MSTIPEPLYPYANKGFPVSLALEIEELESIGKNDETFARLQVLITLQKRREAGYKFYPNKETMEREKVAVEGLLKKWNVEADSSYEAIVHTISEGFKDRYRAKLIIKEQSQRNSKQALKKELLELLAERAELNIRIRDVRKQIKNLTTPKEPQK